MMCIQFSFVQLLSLVRLFATPWTAAYQAPPSMGFSRQEYWSGLPLPSPANGLTSSLLKITNFICSDSAVLSLSVISDLLQPHGLYPTRLLCQWGSPSKNTEVGCHALLQQLDVSSPGVWLCTPAGVGGRRQDQNPEGSCQDLPDSVSRGDFRVLPSQVCSKLS